MVNLQLKPAIYNTLSRAHLLLSTDAIDLRMKPAIYQTLNHYTTDVVDLLLTLLAKLIIDPLLPKVLLLITIVFGPIL